MVNRLLPLLLGLLATHGLAPESLEPWRSWVAFKRYVRVVEEIPDPGVSVQFVRDDSNSRLFFLRQMVELESDRLEPVGGVVCEFEFDASDDDKEWEIWSFDYPVFEDFVDAVEQHAPFALIVNTRPISSAVYWEEA